MTVRVHVGDCRDVLPMLPAGSVHCVVTSPPYFGLRDYGTAQWEGGDPECDHAEARHSSDPVPPAYRQCKHCGRLSRTKWTSATSIESSCDKCGTTTVYDDVPTKGTWAGIKDSSAMKSWTTKTSRVANICPCGATRVDGQIGLEPTPDEFVAALVDVMREARRVLRDDGVAWVVLGSSYASGQSPQRRREPACGTDGTEPPDSIGSGRACPDCGGERPGGFLSRHGRTARTDQSHPEAPSPHGPTDHDSGRRDFVAATPGASHPGVLASTIPVLSIHDQDRDGHEDGDAACYTPPPSSLGAPGSAHTTASPSGLPTYAGATRDRRPCTCGSEVTDDASDHHTMGTASDCVSWLDYTSTLQNGQLLMIPSMVAIALQMDGWVLRQVISWCKKSAMPESVAGTRWERCRVKVAGQENNNPAPMVGRYNVPGAHASASTPGAAEYVPCPGCPRCAPHGGYVLRRGSWRHTSATETVLMLTKGMAYWADQEAVREDAVRGAAGSRFDMGKTGGRDGGDRAQGGYRDPAGRNPRNWVTPSPQPFSGWTETVRLDRVASDAADDGTMRITSPDCPEHAGQPDRIPTAFRGERVAAELTRILDTRDRLARERHPGSVPTGQPPGVGSVAETTDSPARSCSQPASDHSTQSHRTGHDPATTPPCTPSVQTTGHTGDTSGQRALFGPGHDSAENNTSPADSGGRPSAETTGHSVDTSASDTSCTCQFYTITTGKTSHFATYPPALIEPLIRATCPARCCPTCGAGWAPVIDKAVDFTSGSGKAGNPPAGKNGADYEQAVSGTYDVRMGPSVRTTVLAYKPTCACSPADPVPGCVLDPFLGAGTTGLVADRLGLDCIGVELNPDYAQMAAERIRSSAPLFASVEIA